MPAMQSLIRRETGFGIACCLISKSSSDGACAKRFGASHRFGLRRKTCLNRWFQIGLMLLNWMSFHCVKCQSRCNVVRLSVGCERVELRISDLMLSKAFGACSTQNAKAQK